MGQRGAERNLRGSACAAIVLGKRCTPDAKKAKRHTSRNAGEFKAGLKVQDIIVRAVSRKASLFLLTLIETAKAKARDPAWLFPVAVGRADHRAVAQIRQPCGCGGPGKNLIRPLGILGIELNLDIAKNLPDLRIPSGVIVAVKSLGATDGDVPLQTGDVIHALNGTTITGLADLREGLAKLRPGEPVCLQIERYAQLIYVSFVLY